MKPRILLPLSVFCAVLIVVEFIQWSALTELRALQASSDAKLERLSRENEAMAKSLAAIKASHSAKDDKAPGKSDQNAGEAGLKATTASKTMERREAAVKSSALQQYDAFVDQQNLSEAQRDKFYELMRRRIDARGDLQESVKALGLRGDSPEVATMRTRLTEPITKELREVLGETGYSMFRDYEKNWFYQKAFVDPLLPRFASVNLPLTSQQVERLVAIVGTASHSERVNPTDVGSRARVDWVAVERQAREFLSPEQIAVLRRHTEKQ